MIMDELQIFDCDQNSPEWFEARRGIVTASRFSDVLAKGQGITRRKYMLTLAGEAITGECAETYTNPHMERGHIMEAEARDMYAFQNDVDPVVVGFMRLGRVGASPDRLIGSDGLLEVKTKLPHLQLDVLDKGVLPSEHKAQVQGQIWVSGRDWCDFVSYWPKLPLFCIRVERDESYISTLKQAVDDFVGEMDEIIRRFGPQS